MSNEIKKSKVKLLIDNTLAVIAQITGTILIFLNSLFLIAVAASIFDTSDNTSTAIIVISLILLLGFLTASILVLRWGNNTKKLIRTFKNYVCIMSAGSSGKLENVANIIDENEKVVTSNIEKMIKKKYFINAYIDKSKKELIIAGKSLSSANSLDAVNTTCIGCGAVSNNLISEDSYCEYCGSML